jgi:hypothetical protein
MSLQEWMEKTELTILEASRAFDVSTHAVRKWLLGTRIPRSATQRKIKKVTKGAVTPSDWIK